MVSLRELIKASKSNLPVTVRHEKWLVENPNANYSAKALEFAALVLSNELGGSRRRERMFRASGLSYCDRRRVMHFMGMQEKKTIDSHLSNIFHTGNFIHLKWQMAGLTEGWLMEAEVPADNPELGLGGTLDGVLFDYSGLEVKSINERGYKGVMTYGVKQDHYKQVQGCMLLRPDIDRFSVIYENKNTGDWREFRVERDESFIEGLRLEIAALRESAEKGPLPAILSDCKQETGSTYRNCPFKEQCFGATHAKLRTA